jgi:hypothetical protein
MFVVLTFIGDFIVYFVRALHDALKKTQRDLKSVKTESGVRGGCCLSLIMLKLSNGCLTKEARKEFGGFKIGQIIPTVKCADDLALLAKEEGCCS